MPLTAKDRRRLSAEGHHLDAKLTLAEDDVSDNVAAEVDSYLNRHSLMKVRVNTKSREIYAAVIDQLAEKVACEVVQRVGRVALLYRGRQGADSD